jgi:hypothetical protein
MRKARACITIDAWIQFRISNRAMDPGGKIESGPGSQRFEIIFSVIS